MLSYDKLKVLERQAAIFAERPHLHFDIQARLLLFKPAVGSYLVGVVNKVEADHVGLLIHGIFNATVPAAQGLAQLDLEYDPDESAWVNQSLPKSVRAGTRLRVQVSKVVHHMQIVSLECSMLGAETGFCD